MIKSYNIFYKIKYYYMCWNFNNYCYDYWFFKLNDG